MHLEQVQHAARMVALQNALLGLLAEADAFGEQNADGLTVTAQRHRDGTVTVDLMSTIAGMPVAGEGM